MSVSELLLWLAKRGGDLRCEKSQGQIVFGLYVRGPYGLIESQKRVSKVEFNVARFDVLELRFNEAIADIEQRERFDADRLAEWQMTHKEQR